MPTEPLWQRHERETAQDFGGYVTLASGAREERHDVGSNRDGSTWTWMLECKSTQAASYGIKLQLLRDIETHALERREDLRPGLALRFYGDTKGTGLTTAVLGDYVVLTKNDLLELLVERRWLAEEVLRLCGT